MATVDYGLSGNTMKILGEAAKAEAGVGKYASEGFDNFLDTVGEYAGKKMDEAAAEKQAIEDKFNKASEDALALGGSLPTNYFDSYYDDIMGLKEQYLNATDEKQRAEVLNQMNQMKMQTETMKEQRASMADAKENGLLSEGAMTDQQKEIFTQWLEGKTKVRRTEDGTLKHMVTMSDGRQFELTDDEISGMQVLKATEFQKGFGDLMTSTEKLAQTGEFFDVDKVRRQIKTSIRDEDLPSLINDVSDVTGSKFKDDIAAGFEGLNYMQLGQMMGDDAFEPEEGETFWYENISAEDQALLTDALINPKSEHYNVDVTKKALEDYYVKLIEQQYPKYKQGAETAGQYKSEQKGYQDAFEAVAEQQKKKELGYVDPKSKKTNNNKKLNLGDS